MRLDSELSKRVARQKGIVRDIADRAEDIVWQRISRYTVLVSLLVGVILAVGGFIGIRTADDVSNDIAQTTAKVDAAKKSLNQLSADIDTQRRRLSEKNDEMSRKFDAFNSVAADAEKQAEALEAKSKELSEHLDALEKTLVTRVDQISKQVDNVSIRNAYPGLGEKLFVTYNGNPWKGRIGKGSGEKWVNIVITVYALPDYSGTDVEKLIGDLKSTGYTPLVGAFGVGGPFSTAFGPLGGSSDPAAAYYFSKDTAEMGASVCTLVTRVLSVSCRPQLVDPLNLPKGDMERFVIERSGIDVQLALFQRPIESCVI